MQTTDIERKLIDTDIWSLYEECKNYCYMINMYADTDKNYRFYNGDQWAGIKLKGVEPVQFNFIEPIVNYKVATINSNLYAANFSSENIESKELQNAYLEICSMLNKKASQIWEKDNMDYKLREASEDSAINDEGVIYSYWDTESKMPINEVLSKNDIYYGNENDDDIQRQPYVLIKRRMSVLKAQEMARNNGVSVEKINDIVGDNNNFEEAGESAKYEKDDMCTVITKMYKKNGTVHFEETTRYVVITEESDTGLTRYQVAHFPWSKLKGSSRGIGEVRFLIPNQIEVNKNEMRRLLSTKQNAFPQKVANTQKIANPDAIGQVGGIIKTQGGTTIDDVSKVFTVIPPAQMSPDARELQADLISTTRELKGAGDVATGQIDPEKASGKAILAIQQASQQTLNKQQLGVKKFVEDIVRNWLDMLITYSQDGLTLQKSETDSQTGKEYFVEELIPQEMLLNLKLLVKIDVTPIGAFDKYAQELSLENMLKAGYFNIQRLPELKTYVHLLDDNATMPKQKLLKAIEYMEEEQRKIAEIDAQAKIMQQRANQFLSSDVDGQVQRIADAQNAQIPDTTEAVEETT